MLEVFIIRRTRKDGILLHISEDWDQADRKGEGVEVHWDKNDSFRPVIQIIPSNILNFIVAVGSYVV